MTTPIPQRVARQMLTDAGFSFSRKTKHEVWSHPDGRMVSMPKAVTELRGFLAHKVRTYAKGERLTYESVKPWVSPKKEAQ